MGSNLISSPMLKFNQQIRVVLCLDISYSMREFYHNNLMDVLIRLLYPIIGHPIELVLFNDRVYKEAQVDGRNYISLNKRLIADYMMLSGLRLCPLVHALVAQYELPDTVNEVPTLAIVVTRGEAIDEKEAEFLLRLKSKHPIFWQFLGIGKSDFSYLRKLDNMGGRSIDNISFTHVVGSGIRDSFKEFAMWQTSLEQK
jgi:hypothetical protein